MSDQADKLECEKVDALLDMAPGHAFQDRDTWRKLAFAFEIKLREKDFEIKRLNADKAKALDCLMHFFDYRYDDKIEAAIEILGGNNGRNKIDQ